MARVKDLTGQRFGKLTVVKQAGRDPRGNVLWMCRCDCGKQHITRGYSLQSGNVTSCTKCPNQYILEEGRVRGVLNNGEEFLFDSEDYEDVSQHVWSSDASDGYAVTRINGKVLSLHRFILAHYQELEELEVDHINREKLDCRKSNLRTCERRQNNYNQGRRKNNTSGYKGVSWNTQASKWQCQIQHNKKNQHLGFYETKEQAALAYNKKATELFGEFAYLNEIKEE